MKRSHPILAFPFHKEFTLLPKLIQTATLICFLPVLFQGRAQAQPTIAYSVTGTNFDFGTATFQVSGLDNQTITLTPGGGQNYLTYSFLFTIPALASGTDIFDMVQTITIDGQEGVVETIGSCQLGTNSASVRLTTLTQSVSFDLGASGILTLYPQPQRYDLVVGAPYPITLRGAMGALFWLTPVPEPTLLAILCVGVVSWFALNRPLRVVPLTVSRKLENQ